MTVYITDGGGEYKSRHVGNLEFIDVKDGPHANKPHIILGFWNYRGSDLSFEDGFFWDGQERRVSVDWLTNMFNPNPSRGFKIVSRRFEDGVFYRDGDVDYGLYVTSPILKMLSDPSYDNVVGQTRLI